MTRCRRAMLVAYFFGFLKVSRRIMTSETRLTKEATFFDERVGKVSFFSRFYGGIFLRVKEELWRSVPKGSIQTVFELGCGPGNNLREAIRYLPASVRHLIAVDISEESLKLASRLDLGSSKAVVCCVRSDAENLCIAPASIDIVYGFGIIHHLVERSRVYRELARVLRPGGRAVFLEPLAGNWFIDVFRKITSRTHSPSEAPLRWQEWNEAPADLIVKHREFLLSSLVMVVLGSVLPNGTVRRFMESACWMLDEKLLKRWPFLRRYCWVTILEFTCVEN